MEWQECNKQGYAKKVELDSGRIQDIIKSSNDRERTAKLLPVNEITKETVISLFYDTLRELLEALALKHKFKVYNHECYTSFLNNIIKDEELALEFDSLRLLRNSINYYGKKIELNDSRLILLKLEKLIRRIKERL
jgi:hypothetical protein